MSLQDTTAPKPTESGDTLVEGLIIDGSRGLYRVRTPSGDLLCAIRGRLRKELSYAESANTRKAVRKVTVKPHDPVAVGDRVRALPTGGGAGVIEEVVARAGGAFSRRDPDPKAGARGALTTVAGLDQLVAVFATREPEPHLGLLDRLLVVAETQGIAAIICVTKTDQGIDPWLSDRLALYERLGYPLLLTSVTTGAGIALLRERLAGKVSAFIGKSGVGKSSLLNALTPGLGQRVSEVSAMTGKGRHTTTSTRLVPLDGPEGGYIADTAGIRALGFVADSTTDLAQSFREFRPYLGRCEHRGCQHWREPGCAIRAAVASDEIDRERYQSYLRLREGE